MSPDKELTLSVVTGGDKKFTPLKIPLEWSPVHVTTPSGATVQVPVSASAG